MPYGVPWKQLASDTRHKLNEDNVFNGAAALGFYLTLAIFPAMIFTMAVIPYLPIPRVDEAIMDFIRQSLPPAAASMFGEVVNEVMRERRGGLLSFGILATLWATSTGMYAVMMQLNIIYRVKEGRPFIKARLTALGLSLMFIVLVLGAFSLVVLGGVIQDWIGERWGYNSALLTFFVVFRWVVIVLALFLAFALMYYLAPNVQEEKFHFLSPGSFVGVGLLMLATLGFTFYATNFADYDATYGSIGAVILLMLWLYIAGLVILLGAVVNVLLRDYRGERAEASSDGDESDEEAERHVPAH
jgi:membrane protein